jgi:hypothetical protein
VLLPQPGTTAQHYQSCPVYGFLYSAPQRRDYDRAVIPVTIIPGWTDEWTAVGTVAAAAVALGIALWSWLLGHNQKKAEEARRQLAEAYQIQVDTIRAVQPTRTVGLMVNRSPYTVTAVDCRFSDGATVSTAIRRNRFLDPDKIPEVLVRDVRRSTIGQGDTMIPQDPMPDTLTPWAAGIRFESDRVPDNVYCIMRWIDRYGTGWEHKLGQVRQVKPSDGWMP